MNAERSVKRFDKENIVSFGRPFNASLFRNTPVAARKRNRMAGGRYGYVSRQDNLDEYELYRHDDYFAYIYV
jgi:hypothetical protein